VDFGGAGIRAFKAFLTFAKEGHLEVKPGAARGKDPDFEVQVAAALRRAGYQLEAGVGSSGGYRIDLAVVDPASPGRYLLGIEFDGPRYQEARWARDRDRLRQTVLDGLGWKLDDLKESIAPAVSTSTVKTKFLTVNQGSVAGVRQFARGLRGGKEVLTLELQMYVGAPNPRDVIEVVGEPPLKLVIENGVPGDIATPAILVNTLPRLVECPPGLHTMRTIGLPRMAM